MTSHLEPLPAHLTRYDQDPVSTRDELMHVIADALANQPRSLQKRIGPSEIGHPCARRLGYKFLGHPEVNPNQGVPWLPFIGTSTHAGLEGIFDAANLAWDAANGHLGLERYLIEEKVTAGQINGEDIDGSCDLYDKVTGTVIDWKIVGDTQLRKYKAKGPGPQYRTQAHAYGRGWAHKGLPVHHVAVMFLPRNSEVHARVWWSEPYDEQIAIDGFQRASGIHTAITVLGTAALDQLETADAFCHRCPYFKAGSTDVTQGCPGDAHATPTRRQDPILDLITTGATS